jgi:hypothetical protein
MPPGVLVQTLLLSDALNGCPVLRLTSFRAAINRRDRVAAGRPRKPCWPLPDRERAMHAYHDIGLSEWGACRFKGGSSSQFENSSALLPQRKQFTPNAHC